MSMSHYQPTGFEAANQLTCQQAIDRFKFQVNIQCELEGDPWIKSMVYACFAILFLLISAYALRASRYLRDEITAPSISYPDATYCSITLQLVTSARVLLWLGMLELAYSFLTYACGDRYGKWFESQDFLSCPPHPDYPQLPNGAANHFNNFLLVSKLTLSQGIVLLQVFEWISIIYVISTQLDRTEHEIMIDHNVENVLSPVSKGQIAYRRKEVKMKKYMKWLMVVFMAGSFTSLWYFVYTFAVGAYAIQIAIYSFLSLCLIFFYSWIVTLSKKHN